MDLTKERNKRNKLDCVPTKKNKKSGIITNKKKIKTLSFYI